MFDLSACEEEVASYQKKMMLHCQHVDNVEAIPSRVIAQGQFWSLHRYALNDAPKEEGAPLLLVYAFLNRDSIFDLSPSRSFLRQLLHQHGVIYLLRWQRTMDEGICSYLDYVNSILPEGVEALCQWRGADKIDLLGVCQGGVLSACYTMSSNQVRRLILMGTPIDFHKENDLLAHYIRAVFKEKQPHWETWPISAAFLNALMMHLSPFRLLKEKYGLFPLLSIDEKADFYRFEQWLWESNVLNQRVMFSFVEDFYFKNRLLVEKKKITVPVLNVMAMRDHIIPPEASSALSALAGQVTVHCYDTGHVGLYTSKQHHEKVAADISAWLKKSQHL